MVAPMETSLQKRRVVVTGLGLVTPVGNNVQQTWENIQAGKSGIGKITHFDASNLTCQVAGEVKDFDAGDIIPVKERKKCDRFIQMGWVAAHEALTDANLLEAETGKVAEALQPRVATILGSGIGGLPEIEKTYDILQNRGPSRISPFFIPSILVNLLAGQVSMAYGLKGANFAPVSACATGNHAIGDAMRLIERGEADVAVAGGAESCICPLSVAGFAAARALSTQYNDTPETASRPFDVSRDGFVMGEGAGVLVLEEYEHAKARGATIYGELAGFGQSGDAYHMTSPAPDGNGAIRAMEQALADAGLKGSDIDYVNAHATSTPVGDEAECNAIAHVCGKDIVISSTKSMTGHLLGAAGGLEAAITLLALKNNIAPPTINVNEQDEKCPLDVVPNTAKALNINAAMSNSFGFGGTNACLLFKAV